MLKPVLIATAVCVASVSAAQTPQPAPAAPPRPTGYLPKGAVDGSRFLPPVPAAGSPQEAADKAAYAAAGTQVDSPRWKQAAADDDFRTPALLAHYRCALGVSLTEETSPVLSRLLGRVRADAGSVAEATKLKFMRPRPFAEDAPDAPLCLTVPPEARGRASTAYPSGHTVGATVFGLVLSELAPDRADEVMRRTAELNESRVVCRLHYPSDIRAGEILGSVVYARLQAEPEFRKDVEAARAEMTAARTSAPKPDGCPAG